MAPLSQQIADMVDMLPESDQSLAFEMVRKLVLAWDPDFTKLTPTEAARLEAALGEVERGEVVSDDAINWD